MIFKQEQKAVTIRVQKPAVSAAATSKRNKGFHDVTLHTTEQVFGVSHLLSRMALSTLIPRMTSSSRKSRVSWVTRLSLCRTTAHVSSGPQGAADG